MSLMSKIRSFSSICLYFGLLFFLSFAAQLVLAQPNRDGYNIFEISGECLKADIHSGLGHPFSFPAIPESPEDGDEDDRDDRLEDEFSGLVYFTSSNGAQAFLTNCSLAQFQRVIENKSFPSLYILYHSWRSFLA
jgi:hypothetical protein